MELELGLALPVPAGRELDLLNSAPGSCRKRCFSEAALGVNATGATPPHFARREDANGPGGGGGGDAAGDCEMSKKRKKLVGWPPVKSAHRRCCGGGGYVKVKTEGVAIGRKVDLSLHGSYDDLLDTLRIMFPSTHQSGGYDSQDGQQRRRDHDYAVTYEDGDGDWMLVGDVPWEAFCKSVKRLKILV